MTQLVLAKEVLYNPAIVALKISILLFYRRCFAEKGLNTSFRFILWGTGAFVVLYSGLQTMLAIFQCDPINSLWNSTVTGRCMSMKKVMLSFSGLNIATDILMLILPLPHLWKLKLPLRRKGQLIAIFLLGGL